MTHYDSARQLRFPPHFRYRADAICVSVAALKRDQKNIGGDEGGDGLIVDAEAGKLIAQLAFTAVEHGIALPDAAHAKVTRQGKVGRSAAESRMRCLNFSL